MSEFLTNMFFCDNFLNSRVLLDDYIYYLIDITVRFYLKLRILHHSICILVLLCVGLLFKQHDCQVIFNWNGFQIM